MNELMIFEGNDVEVFELNGEVLFNPRDVAKCLNLNKDATSKAVSRMSDKQVIKITNSNMTNCPFRKLHNTGENFLTESGVYKLIFKSRSDGAEKFQDWIADEVLPSIRKHGAYMTPQRIEDLLANPDTIIQLATTLKEERAKRIELENKVEEDKPKILFANAVETAKTSILIGELAKLIKQNGINIGQQRLFEHLRKGGYLSKRRGEMWNIPTQKSMNLGLFEIKKRVIQNPDGSSRVTRTTKVTYKGQEYFIGKYLTNEKGVLITA